MVVPAGIAHSARFNPGFRAVTGAVELPAHARVPMALVITDRLRIRLLDAQWCVDSSSVETIANEADAVGEVLREDIATAAQLPYGDLGAVVVPIGPVSGPVAAALHSNPADPRTLEDFAAQLHTSVVSIRRAFRDETGLPFSQWRTQVRLRAAVTLLQRGQTVARVAARVGLSHNGLLSAMRKHYGCTPSDLVARPADPRLRHA